MTKISKVMDRILQFTTNSLIDRPPEVNDNVILQGNNSLDEVTYQVLNYAEQSEILVVDDTPNSLLLLTAILEKKGYLVRSVSSGPLALQSVAAKLPDLILLAEEIEKMDGYEVCRRLKSVDHSCNVPVIFISALNETHDKVKGFKAGGVDYITKPIDPEEVLARVETHLQLQKLTHHLEERTNLIQNQTIELSKVKDQAKAANIAKSKFLAKLSHKLRSPLTPILGYAHILKMQKNLTSEQKDQLQIICDSCAHLTALISNMENSANLDLLKEKIETAAFDLRDVIMDVVSKTQKKAQTKNLVVQYEELTPLPERVLGDEGLLRQVLHHLLDNGVKFTKQGRVSLRLCVIESPQDKDNDTESGEKWKLRFEIEDTGIGISDEQIEDMFKPFYQSKKENSLIANTGLGLALSRRVVEIMGGRLSVKSPSAARSEFEEWPGSVFTLELDFGAVE